MPTGTTNPEDAQKELELLRGVMQRFAIVVDTTMSADAMHLAVREKAGEQLKKSTEFMEPIEKHFLGKHSKEFKEEIAREFAVDKSKIEGVSFQEAVKAARTLALQGNLAAEKFSKELEKTQEELAQLKNSIGDKEKALQSKLQVERTEMFFKNKAASIMGQTGNPAMNAEMAYGALSKQYKITLTDSAEIVITDNDGTPIIRNGKPAPAEAVIAEFFNANGYISKNNLPSGTTKPEPVKTTQTSEGGQAKNTGNLYEQRKREQEKQQREAEEAKKK